MVQQNQKKRILIIEDESDVTTYLATLLSDQGYEIETAADGIEAMQKIQVHKPDLISLDISLPEKTGINIYCELKANPDLKTIPVVMVTGIEKTFQNYISSQDQLPPPDGFISKPFVVDELLRVISNLLN